MFAAYCCATAGVLASRLGDSFLLATVVVAPGDGSTSVSGVSWPAIVAGAVAAFAMTLVLLAFGTGLGLAMVSPRLGAGISATTVKNHGNNCGLDRRLPCRQAAGKVVCLAFLSAKMNSIDR